MNGLLVRVHEKPIVQIARDPFARSSLMRQVAPDWEAQNGCKWCGHLGRQFYYWQESDGGTRFPYRHRACRNETKPFCSVSCYRAYYS
jgi:hypothetical protein